MGWKRKFKNPFVGERGRFVLLRWRKGLFLLLFAGVVGGVFFAVKGAIIEKKSEIGTLKGARPDRIGTLKSVQPITTLKSARPLSSLKVARPIPTLKITQPIRNLNITKPVNILSHFETGMGSGKSARREGRK